MDLGLDICGIHYIIIIALHSLTSLLGTLLHLLIHAFTQSVSHVSVYKDMQRQGQELQFGGETHLLKPLNVTFTLSSRGQYLPSCSIIKDYFVSYVFRWESLVLTHLGAMLHHV